MKKLYVKHRRQEVVCDKAGLGVIPPGGVLKAVKEEKLAGASALQP